MRAVTAVIFGCITTPFGLFVVPVMPKKTGVNTKVAAANDRKASAQKEKDKKKAEEAEQREAADWAGGAKGKSKKDADAEKKVSYQIAPIGLIMESNCD
jgi:hypothetical protein